MFIEQIFEFELREPGLSGRACTLKGLSTLCVKSSAYERNLSLF